MPSTAAEHPWTDQDRAACQSALVRGGWTRVVPHATFVALMCAGLAETAPTREELGAAITTEGLAGPCWDGPDEDNEDGDEQYLAAARADAARYAAHYGLGAPQTVDDLITLLVAAGVLVESPGPAGPVLRPVRPMPGPGDVFPLADAERQVLADLERRRTYSSGASAIIGLFEPRGARIVEITTSLDRLARAIGRDAEHARQCVLQLLGDGDFTATADIAAVAGHNVFRLRCDWEAFDAGRIGVQGRTEDGRIRVTLPAGW
ncbi:DUF6042 family protein [Kitasatospora sp. KL5]|uniref:DUF6042 family protein n=1 Tax=Kitasatospora sp. KL5 TaxID=3425125 RepID=UPI003D6EFFFD